MVATQLLRFHGELPSLRFERWRSRVASEAATSASTAEPPLHNDPSTPNISPDVSQHLIITRSRPLSSICPSPVYARLSRHVSGLWRWSLYRLVGSAEQPQQQEPQYDPRGMRASSGLTVEAEARITELKRVLNLPEDRPPVLALLDDQNVPVLQGHQYDIEQVREHDLESVLEHVSERYLGDPFEESAGRIEELEGDFAPEQEAKTKPVTANTPPRTPSTRDHTPRTPSNRESAPRTPLNQTPVTPTPQRVSPQRVSSQRVPASPAQDSSVSALGMTPLNIPKPPVKEAPAKRVSSPSGLSPLSGVQQTKLSPTRSPTAQTQVPSTPPSQMRDGLRSTPVKSAASTPARSIPSTPHKSLPSPPSSPLGGIGTGQLQEPEGPDGVSPSTPKQQPAPLPMSPGRDALSPGNPLTPGTNTGTDATPLSPRTPLSPALAFQHFVRRNESHSELLEHVERFKSGSIRSLEAVQAGLGGPTEQTSEQQESELARVFKRIRGRRAVIT